MQTNNQNINDEPEKMKTDFEKRIKVIDSIVETIVTIPLVLYNVLSEGKGIDLKEASLRFIKKFENLEDLVTADDNTIMFSNCIAAPVFNEYKQVKENYLNKPTEFKEKVDAIISKYALLSSSFIKIMSENKWKDKDKSLVESFSDHDYVYHLAMMTFDIVGGKDDLFDYEELLKKHENQKAEIERKISEERKLVLEERKERSRKKEEERLKKEAEEREKAKILEEKRRAEAKEKKEARKAEEKLAKMACEDLQRRFEMLFDANKDLSQVSPYIKSQVEIFRLNLTKFKNSYVDMVESKRNGRFIFGISNMESFGNALSEVEGLEERLNKIYSSSVEQPQLAVDMVKGNGITKVAVKTVLPQLAEQENS